MSTHLYDVNAHLHCGAERPAGVMAASIKTEHVITVRPHKRGKAHRAVYAVTVHLGGRVRLGARFACGAASNNVRPVTDLPAGMRSCAGCDRVAMGGTFCVYAYYDAAGRVLYVGQTADMSGRHRAHSHSARWFSDQQHRAVLSEHTTRADAKRAEAEAIAALAPVHNIQRPTLHLVAS